MVSVLNQGPHPTFAWYNSTAWFSRRRLRYVAVISHVRSLEFHRSMMQRVCRVFLSNSTPSPVFVCLPHNVEFAVYFPVEDVGISAQTGATGVGPLFLIPTSVGLPPPTARLRRRHCSTPGSTRRAAPSSDPPPPRRVPHPGPGHDTCPP